MASPIHALLDRLIAAVESGGVLMRRLVYALLAFFALAGIVNLAPYVVGDHPRAIPVDFSAFWAAGRTWIDGASPYTDAFTDVFVKSGLPHLHDAPPPYFYPPNSIVLVLGLGLLSPGEASFIMSVVNLAAFIVSALLFAALFAGPDALQRRYVYGALYLGICGALWKASEVVFLHNTLAYLVFAGFLACLLGVRRGSSSAFAVGLFLCLMKPQLGVPILAAGFLMRSTRGPSIAAFCATCVAAIAGLSAGAPGSFAAFLKNLSVYGDFPENAPANVGGMGHMVFLAGGPEFSIALWLAVTLAAIVAAYFAVRTDNDEIEKAEKLLMFAAISGSLFLPAHNNYYLALAPVFMLLPAGPLGKIALACAAAATMSAWDISAALASAGVGYLQLNAATIDSLAILTLFVVSLRSIPFAILTSPMRARSQQMRT